MAHVIAIVGLGLACVLWGVLGRWVARQDPALGNRVEKERGCCGLRQASCGGGQCERDGEHPHAGRLSH